MSYPTYSDLELEIQNLEESIRELRKENKNLKLTIEQMENTCKDYLNDRDTLREENRKLKEKIRFLEQCLDNKEKVNKSLREELEKLKKF